MDVVFMSEELNKKPNLDYMDHCGGFVTTKGYERYKSVTACSRARNIPKKVLLQARHESAPGISPDGIVKTELFLPWLQENYERLERLANKEEAADSPQRNWQLQKLKQEVIKLRNFNKARSSAYISRKLVFETILKIKSSWVDYLRQKLEYELPAKCANMTQQELKESMTKVCDELLYKFSSPLSDWQKPSQTDEAEEQDDEEEDELNEFIN